MLAASAPRADFLVVLAESPRHLWTPAGRGVTLSAYRFESNRLMITYLSGIQPSGFLHLGNYFGAIRQHVRATELPGEHFYFIADYHALTTVRDPELLRTYVREVAVSYLALGLDPERACFFRQTDVPEVQEIAWLLSCQTGMGLLERAHSYKDKVANEIKPTVGLFYYPVLMAADILAYDSTVVPVGRTSSSTSR